MPPITASRTGRRDQRRAQQRQNLFDTLERLLGERPFPEITVPQILEAAKISRSTFYLYFDGKAELLLATADAVFTTADGVASAWWNRPADISPAELEEALLSVFALYRQHHPVLRGLVDAAGYEPAVRERLSEMHEVYIDGLERHLVHGQQVGFVRSDLPTRPTAEWIIWMIERGLYQLVALADEQTLPERAQALAAILWHAVYVDSGAP